MKRQYCPTCRWAVDESGCSCAIGPTFPLVCVSTLYVYPPIPDRGFDWSATLDGYEPGDAMGEGATEREAIDSLFDALEAA